MVINDNEVFFFYIVGVKFNCVKIFYVDYYFYVKRNVVLIYGVIFVEWFNVLLVVLIGKLLSSFLYFLCFFILIKESW